MIFEPVSYWQYKDLTWRLPDTADYARERPTLTLTAGDLRTACRISPIGFLNLPDGWTSVLLNREDHNFEPVFNTRWFGYRLPASVALYPFSIVWQEQTKEWVLGVAKDPALIGEGGEPFFTPEGPLTRRLMVAYRRLCIMQSGKKRLAEAIERLAGLGAFAPIDGVRFGRQVPYFLRVDQIPVLLEHGVSSVELELAMTAAFSLGRLPVGLLAKVEGYLRRPTAVLALVEQADLALVSQTSASSVSADNYIFGEDDALQFSFSARDSIFKPG